MLDPDFYHELYGVGTSKKLDKYEPWVQLAGTPQATFSTVSHDVHRIRRGALNPFFSKRSVHLLETNIRDRVEKLARRFCQLCASGEIVRLDVAFMALTMDIISDYAFDDDRHYLEEDDFKLQWKETILGAWQAGALLRAFPWILTLTKIIPQSLIARGDPRMGHLLEWQAGVREQVAAILNETEEEKKKKRKSRKTIFHTLRDSDLPPNERTLDRLRDEAVIITGAGSETTAKAVTHISFYLLSNPEILLKLQAELKV